ncbi:hypothetical protein COV19_03445 [Candidatus Woesearchaeota archaeon CG10_big_fil_rev_8_21_14_0_10_44_13]|nr:MAG: hypothetical protein COV19_03445 [Candidatus Woesearchaeota archaeon CG10_big_fil_rev_8_21_14_0_10_44_13]
MRRKKKIGTGSIIGAIALIFGLMAMMMLTISSIKHVDPAVIFMINVTSVAIVLVIASFTRLSIEKLFVLIFVGIIGLDCILLLIASQWPI